MPTQGLQACCLFTLARKHNNLPVFYLFVSFVLFYLKNPDVENTCTSYCEKQKC